MNKDAWAQIYNQHYEVLVKNITRRAEGNTHLAEDVVQSVFEKLMTTYPDDIKTIRSIGGLLQTSATNLFVDGYRQRVKQLDARGNRFELDDFKLRSSDDVETTVMEVIRNQCLDEAIKRLPDEYHDVMKLLSKGFGYEEIAANLNIEIGTVKSRISRGKEKLKNDKSLFT